MYLKKKLIPFASSSLSLKKIIKFSIIFGHPEGRGRTPFFIEKFQIDLNQYNQYKIK